MHLLCNSILHKYLKSATISKDFLATFMLWLSLHSVHQAATDI